MVFDKINLDELAGFIVEAKKATYAGNGVETMSESLPGYKALEHRNGVWRYLDTYSGHYAFPDGNEKVWRSDVPIWGMSYGGRIVPHLSGDPALSKPVYTQLRKILALVKPSKPFRGPDVLVENPWLYHTEIKGDISWFYGNEFLRLSSEPVYEGNFFGGLIIQK